MQYIHCGIKDACVQDVMTLENETYDTILLLNGAKPFQIPLLYVLIEPGVALMMSEDGGKWTYNE
jgi:hypothetical protein